MTYFATHFFNPTENSIADSDVAGTQTSVYVISRLSGEGVDRKNVKGDFLLSDSETQNLQCPGRVGAECDFAYQHRRLD
ncbi:hypothetical protein [Lonepinella koalarum]|uniref:hypothetical protein n=1 Tax=Lonepinella koalarum TaxID=53417 RepID=UPI001073B91C|nr:hypothetical protein [Lonepinella koalarum]TFJ90035.1 hypothetical protein E0709_05160 [Lonepinella koalarum]